MTDKEEFTANLRTFENFFDFSVDVSDHIAGLTVPIHLIRANQLYTRLTVTSLSIIHLLPTNRIFPAKWEFWDFFSVATLARNLIENYHMLYYIGIEEVADEERDFRLKLFNFHLNNEKYQLYLGFKAEASVLEQFENNLPVDRDEIRQHPFFSTLSKEKGNRILKGKEVSYLSHKEISERIPFKTDEFNPFYRLFSNHTHSTPFAFFTMSNERGRGKENEVEVIYLTMTLDFCIKYLAAAILDITKLFPSCIDKISSEKLRIVKEKFADYLKPQPR